jgi:hypothetical protein
MLKCSHWRFFHKYAKSLGSFGKLRNFSLCCPKKLGPLLENPWEMFSKRLEMFWQLRRIFTCYPIISGTLFEFEESFHLCPSILGILEKSWCLKKFGHFRTLYVAWSFRAPYIKAEICFGFCPSLWVALSHERESMLARTILEALVNMRGVF